MLLHLLSVAVLLLLAAPTDWAQAGEGSDITNTPPSLGPLQGG